MTPAAYGSPHPDAPDELSLFAFLIGKWRGEGTSRDLEGATTPYRMTWVGRYILDGYAIADDAHIFDKEGALERIFITYRFYDRAARRWIIECVNLMDSTMVRQAPDDLGNVQADDSALTLLTRWPTTLGRELFLDRGADHFTYRMDVSTDEGKTWIEGIDTIEATRTRS